MPGKELPAHEPEFPPDIGQSKTWAEAVRGMVDRPFLKTGKYAEQQKRADRAGAHPDLLEFERLLIRRMAALGVPMFGIEVLRSNERQNQLYRDGRTKAKAGQGPHPYGCAVDIVHSGKGWSLTDWQWLVIGHVGKEAAKAVGIKVTWGGDWKPNANGVGWDPAHWQVSGWKAEMTAFPFPTLEKWERAWRKRSRK